MKRAGISVVHVILIVILVLIVGGAVYTSFTKNYKQVRSKISKQASTYTLLGQNNNTEKHNDDELSNTTWEYDGTSWRSGGQKAACKSPFMFTQAPADLTLATHVHYPGQYRGKGGLYKPHGGYRFEGVKNNEVTVVAPYDAFIVRGSRYVEQGEIQYMFDFQLPCGMMYRFDHLYTLTPILESIASQFPEAKVDDSRTTNLTSPVAVKAGTPLATKIGFLKTNNPSFDFGVYDLTKRNASSTDAAWLTKHQTELELAGHAICWFDLLPPEDATRTKSLPAGDQLGGKNSDYCK